MKIKEKIILSMMVLLICFMSTGCLTVTGFFTPTKTLTETVKKNDIASARELLAEGADVNERDQEGRTPLEYAVGNNSIDFTMLFIENGADINLAFKQAMKNGNVELAKFLLENGADISTMNETECDQLMSAVKNGDINLEEFLSDNEIVVNNVMGMQALLMAAIKARNLDVVKLLLTKGADVNQRNNSGKIPLIHAVEKGNFKIVKLLVENGADVNQKDNSGKTPLISAVERSTFEVVKLLAENGADVNQKDNSGKTPLISAVEIGDFEIVKLLVENGADIKVTRNGKSLYDIAKDREFLKIFDFLKKNITIDVDPSMFIVELTDDGKGAKIVGYTGPETGQIVIPKTIQGYIVKEVHSLSDFQPNGITLPDTVEIIGSIGHNLESVDLPSNLRIINNKAFYYGNLKNVSLPNKVVEIYAEAFYKCKNLTSIVIPNSVRFIGYSAFAYSGLQSVEFPTKQPLKIGTNAFSNTKIKSVTITPNMDFELGKGFLIFGRKGSYCFSYCSELEKVIIKKDVVKLPSGLFVGNNSLTDVIFESPDTVIAEDTFLTCPNLSLASQAEIRKHIRK